MADFTRDLGQLFMCGFPGPAPNPTFLNFISEERLGGVIIFEENCPTHQAARLNIERIRSTQPDAVPFIAIDQEGGRVCRLRGAPAEFRAAADYGRDSSTERFVEDYSRAAVYLEALGVNCNLAPVADIFTNTNNAVLDGRCFGSDPDKVADFVRASVNISRRSGLLSCLKHFPGLGAGNLDPHVETPAITFDDFVWHQREAVPFLAGIDEGADMIMTTHVVLPELDDKIVTGSSAIIEGLLRRELDFDGPVITDDLTMNGAAELGTIGERTVAAFLAGHDILLFGRDYEQTMQAFDYFVDAVRRGEISRTRLTASLERVAGLKMRLRRVAIQ